MPFPGSGILAQDQRVADSLGIIYREERRTGNEKLELLRNLSFNELNDPALSLRYAEELIGLAQADDNLLYLHRGYLQKGNTLLRLGELEKALDAFFRSSEAALNAGYLAGEGSGYMAVADVYSLEGNEGNAELYYDKAIQLLRKTKDSVALATALLNTADFYLHNQQYVKALRYFEEAGVFFKELNHRNGLAYYLGGVGMVLAAQGKNEAAKTKLNEAIKMLEELKDYYPIAVYLNTLSHIYSTSNDLDQAQLAAQKSLTLAKTYGLKDQISDANLQLSQLYEKKGNISASYKYYKDYITYRDSVNNLATVREMANLRTNHELSQKQIQVDLLEKESELQLIKEKSQKNFILAVVIAFICVMIMALGLLHRYIFIRKTKRIIEAEKNRSDKLLINILPEETANELKLKGSVRAKKYDSVTVLFTDFKGFTRYAENLTPEDLVKSIDFYFTKFDEIFEKNGMEKIKTIGDSYMCSGGLHSHIGDHAIKMVQAALEVLQFVDDIKKNNATELNFDIRIGINTGPIVAGVVGNKKFAYDIWGDTVNVASHMESNSIPGKINIAQNTYDLVKEVYDCEYRGEIKVKNRGSLKMYFVNGIKDHALIKAHNDRTAAESLKIS
jgi:class 3 adenylate cyclase